MAFFMQKIMKKDLTYEEQMDLLTRKNMLTISTKTCRKVGVIPAVVFSIIFKKHSEVLMFEKLIDGRYFKVTVSYIQEETGLATKTISRAISKLKSEGFVSSKRMGLPACQFFCINSDEVLKSL